MSDQSAKVSQQKAAEHANLCPYCGPIDADEYAQHLDEEHGISGEVRYTT